MKNILIYAFAFLSLVAVKTEAQSFPYLNASTGNYQQSATLPDSSILMFNGYHLAKIDKNKNVVWSRYYSVSFRSVLYSKTNSIFFIGVSPTTQEVIGKMTSNGTIDWIQAVGKGTLTVGTSTAYAGFGVGGQLLLDRNNRLVVTVPAYNNGGLFMKFDTTGLLLSSKIIK